MFSEFLVLKMTEVEVENFDLAAKKKKKKKKTPFDLDGADPVEVCEVNNHAFINHLLVE